MRRFFRIKPRAIFQFCVVFLLLFTCLFAEEIAQTQSGVITSLFRECFAVCRDKALQWILVVCLSIYFCMLQIWAFREKNRRLSEQPLDKTGKASQIFCIFFVMLCLVGYVCNYLALAESTQLLVLLAGIVIGQAFAVWVNFSLSTDDIAKSRAIRSLVAVLAVIVGLLSVAALYQPDSGPAFTYHAIRRWTGPFDNPNLFGMLMGAGCALVIGLLTSNIQHSILRIQRKKWVAVPFLLAAEILCGIGLSKSYSRGAWLGMAVGLGYLILKSKIKNQESKLFGISWLKRNWVVLAVVLAATGAICSWQFWQTDWHPARRALSAVSPVDFSWRNRVTAWVGDLQTMAEHPWLGTGWNQPELLYGYYYLPPKLAESTAIQMNDYLMLGATLGIPALFCLGMYLWLSLTGKLESGKRETDNLKSAKGGTNRPPQHQPLTINHHLSTRPSDWLQTTSRAGAIVLLVGFWFDGGLFKLATAAIFWVLLELGSQKGQATSPKGSPLVHGVQAS